MIRLLLRFLGFWALAAALCAGVIDGTKSVARSAVVTTPFSETWASLSAEGFAAARAFVVEQLGQPWAWSFLESSLFALPTRGPLGLLRLILILLGRRPRRRAQIGVEAF